MRFFLLPLLLLVACPDPTAAPTTPPEGAPTSPEMPDVPGTADAPPTTGNPTPGTDIGFKVVPGEGVTVSGSIAYSGEKTGKIRLDFLRLSANNPPQLAHTVELPQYGPWSVETPKEAGDLRLVGFLDQTGDGPSKDDPAMAWKDTIHVSITPVTGLNIVLSDNPDLGDLTPGNAGGGGAPGPAGAAAPTGGAPDASATGGIAPAPPDAPKDAPR